MRPEVAPASPARSSRLAGFALLALGPLATALLVAAFPVGWALLVAVGVPLVMALFVVLFYAPEWGLVLLFVTLYNPLVVFQRLNLLEWSYAATFGLVGLTALALKLHHPTLPRLPWGATHLALVPMVLAVVLSALHGVVAGNAPHHLLSDFVQILELPLVFWLAAEVFRSVGHHRRVLAVVLGVLLVNVTWELLIYATQRSLLPGFGGAGELRLATLGNDTVLAGFSPLPAIALPVLAAVLIFGRAGTSRRLRAVLLAGVGLCFLSVVISFSRSLWAAEAFAFVCLLALGVRVVARRRLVSYLLRAATIVGVSLLLLAVVPVHGQPLGRLILERLAYTTTQLETNDNPGIESRRWEYRVALDGLEKRPLIGTGLGSKYVGHLRGDFEPKHFFHNTYLGILFRMGVIGLAAVAATLGFLVLRIVRRLSPRLEPLSRGLIIGAVAAVLGIALLSVADGALFVHPMAAYTGFLLALGHHLVLPPGSGLPARHRP